MITYNQIQKRLNKEKPKNTEVKFKKVPAGEITAKQAKEVIERMKLGMKKLDPFMKLEKPPFWKRVFMRKTI